MRVSCVKIDPYVSVDAGLMAPAEHGECFVLRSGMLPLMPCCPPSHPVILTITSGSEVDLDLGNYERYLAVTLGGDNNITTGKIYQHVCSLMSSPRDHLLTTLRLFKKNAVVTTSEKLSKCVYFPA